LLSEPAPEPLPMIETPPAPAPEIVAPPPVASEPVPEPVVPAPEPELVTVPPEPPGSEMPDIVRDGVVEFIELIPLEIEELPYIEPERTA
jgi:hypothetical protein